MDVATANHESNDVSVLLGRGDGTFETQKRYYVGLGPSAIVAADLNGDAKLDLATTAGYDEVSVLLGNGDGTYQLEQRFRVGAAPSGLIATDLNGDGRVDLATVNRFSNDVSVLLGNGDGIFQAEQRLNVGAEPTALVAADFNGDGRVDLASSNGTSGDVSVLIGKGDGAFDAEQRPSLFDLGFYPNALVAADVYGDGRMDLIALSPGYGFMGQDFEPFVSVVLGNGDGTFQTENRFALADAALVSADLNGDGKVDLSSNGSYVLLASGEGTFFQNPQLFPLWAGLAAADVDGDNHLDLLTVNGHSNDISVLVGNGDGTFHAKGTFAVGEYPGAMAASDLNGDGKVDLATANYDSNDLSFLLGNADGTFRPQLRFGFSVRVGPGALVAADFDGDGNIDFEAAGGGSATLLGNGDGTFQIVGESSNDSGTTDLLAADLNGDGRMDLSSSGDGVSVALGNGDGTWTFASGLYVRSRGLKAAHLNGDPHLDLAFVSDESNDVWVLVGNGDGTFQAEQRFSAGLRPSDLIAADLNGDGRIDLATANSGSSDISVLLNSPIDQVSPAVHCPEALNVPCTDPKGAVVDFVATAEDDCDASVTVVSSPPPGSTFPVGTTTVTCTTTDASGNQAIRAFQVTVTCGLQIPGDANQDKVLDLSDAVWLLGHLFLGMFPTLPCEGGTANHPGTGDLALLDSNGDGRIDLSDVVSVLGFLYSGSKPPILGTRCTVISACPEACSS
jgi:hypothetical protein